MQAIAKAQEFLWLFCWVNNKVTAWEMVLLLITVRDNWLCQLGHINFKALTFAFQILVHV